MSPSHRNAMPESIDNRELSIVIPAKNEAASLGRLLCELTALYPGAEIIVVDDGSSDDTRTVSESAGVTVISHPYSKGNGAAIKTGVRAANGRVIACMDGDGQHRPEDLALLRDRLAEGYDLVVGARGTKSQASVGRWFGNKVYNLIATWVVGHSILDLTSGFRIFRADKFREFLHLLPNGFSYPTTSTMAFFRVGYSVAYVPVRVKSRTYGSKSHIRFFRDGARFLLIIFRIGTLYSPLKLFVPVSGLFFTAGVLYYLYTFLEYGKFTNGVGLLLVSSVLVFLIGLVSEQITQLLYTGSDSLRK